MDYPNIFKALEIVLKDNAFTIDYLRDENNTLRDENSTLRVTIETLEARIKELENELEEAKF